MKIEDLKQFEIIMEKEIPDLNSKGYLMKHKKSGARVVCMQNDDKNKVFSIGFRTPPADSTGVPHIMEHSVLCGSKAFPVKDPFVELVKGSLNTFLNAMTYPDKTVYPVASCNDQDFQNLMHVYMDAVFYPNIFSRKEIFMQEGWHYELESKDADITYNGVVYNEMKGAFSSPDDVLDRMIYNSLYPDTTYALESGGDPDDIPNLTYEAFLDFHKRYYHPSNSYIYLYGDMDMAEKLTWLDQEYLSSFDQAEIPSEITLQKPFDKTIEIHKTYSVTEEEPMEDNTYLSYNAVVDTSLNRELYVAFQILEYSLLGAPGAPLKQALLDKKIGKDIMSTYENGIYQPYFSVIAKNANIEQRQEFLDTIHEVLEGLVKNGLDRKSLEAGVNYFEFKYREADFGAYPKGLMYGLQSYDSWLYDEEKPFIHIEANETFAYIRSHIDTGYFEELIQKYLLDNPHSSIVIVEPERGLTAKKDEIVAEKLAEYKASLTDEELEEIVQNTLALKKYQEEPSSQEELETIPLLKLSDIEKKADPLVNQLEEVEGVPYLYHEVFTNGIGYVRLLFHVNDITEEEIPYLGLLKTVLGLMDTENFSYADLFNEINRKTGGINSSQSLYSDIHKPEEYQSYMEISSKVLFDKMGFAYDMMQEIICRTKFTDKKRLLEIISMIRSRLQNALPAAGHSTAALRVMSYVSEGSYYSDMISGIGFFRFIDQMEKNFDSCADQLIAKLEELCNRIYCRNRMMVDFTGSKEAFEQVKVLTGKLCSKLNTSHSPEKKLSLPVQKKNEGFKTSSQVQYVAVAGNFRKAGLEYNGALKVLRVIMGYDYLWNNVRVKGGAYGCMNSFSRLGDSYFVSYRDPNLEKTIEIYKQAYTYVKDFQAEDRDMLKFIIGTISDLDVPLTPKMVGARSLSAYLSNCSFEDIQKERDEILAADQKKIQELAPYVKAITEENNLCVIGGEEKVKAQEGLFISVENLLS